jgi:hypothetical protein
MYIYVYVRAEITASWPFQRNSKLEVKVTHKVHVCSGINKIGA